jgi:hypothetical protein
MFSDEAVDPWSQQRNRLREVLQSIACYRDARLDLAGNVIKHASQVAEDSKRLS